MTTPKYVRVLFVGGPIDGQTREVEYRERYVVDVWTPADFDVRPRDADLVVPVNLFHYAIHVLRADPDAFYVFAPDGWSGTDVMKALLTGYGKKIVKTG